MVEELEKLVVLGPKGSFELASKPELKVEPINVSLSLKGTQGGVPSQRKGKSSADGRPLLGS